MPIYPPVQGNQIWYKSRYFAEAIMDHCFQNTALPTINSSLYFALYTDDPLTLDGGLTSGTNEVAYTGYARVQVARDSLTWGNNGTRQEVYLLDDVIWPHPEDVTGPPYIDYVAIVNGPNTTDSILYLLFQDVGEFIHQQFYNPALYGDGSTENDTSKLFWIGEY